MIDGGLKRYIELIEMFLENSINAQQFEERYLHMFKNEAIIFPNDKFQILDELFAAIDAFCPNSELCDDDDLNEEQLRAKAAELLSKLISSKKTET